MRTRFKIIFVLAAGLASAQPVIHFASPSPGRPGEDVPMSRFRPAGILEVFQRRDKLAYRGYLSAKNDKDVIEADLAKCNIGLFGDPGSNRWIGNLNGRLPVTWTKESVAVGARSFPAAGSVPALIYPNPASPTKYVVPNSVLTADWQDWAGDHPTPQHGDFAVLPAMAGADGPAVALAGVFNEAWRLP